MYANKVKKVVAVHDLSGVGRVSLTVVIPILSSMGFHRGVPLSAKAPSVAYSRIVEPYPVSGVLFSGLDG